jgi:conjugal transfer pilus assembly protein TraK
MIRQTLIPALAVTLSCLAATISSAALQAALPPVSEDPTIVLPELATRVRLSASDVNRLVCQEEIKDVVTSKEKGVIVKIVGKSAFIKFVVVKKGEKLTYSETPTELFVVCGDAMFNLVAMPSRIPAQTIQLSTGHKDRIKENISLFEGLPFEQKILKVIRESYTEEIPDSYVIRKFDMKPKISFKEINILLRREIEIEGEGLKIREYEASIKGTLPELLMHERMFLHPGLAENPVAVAIEEPLLKHGETTRVFIVETKPTSAGNDWGATPNPLVSPDLGKDATVDNSSRAPMTQAEGVGE